MERLFSRTGPVCFLVLVAGVPAAAWAAALTGVGTLGGASSSVSGISPDGTVACGTSNNGTADEAFIYDLSGAAMHGLGIPAGADASEATGVAIDVNGVVVSVNAVTAGARSAYRWNGVPAGAGVLTKLPLYNGEREWTARGIAASWDGMEVFVVGNSTQDYTVGDVSFTCDHQCRWYQSTDITDDIPMSLLPSNSHDETYSYAVSRNGNIVGRRQYYGGAMASFCTRGAFHPFLYEAAIDDCYAPRALVGGPSTAYAATAMGISVGGDLFVGHSWYDNGSLHWDGWGQACLWLSPTATPKAVTFPPLPPDVPDGGWFSEALATNAYGTVIGGYCEAYEKTIVIASDKDVDSAAVGDDVQVLPVGFKDTNLSGSTVCVRWGPNRILDTPVAAPGDKLAPGEVVVPSQAFIAVRDAATGTITSWLLKDKLTELGIDTTGWTFARVTGISQDGSVIVGDGVHNGQPEGWIVTGFPAPPIPAPPAPTVQRPVYEEATEVVVTGLRWDSTSVDLYRNGELVSSQSLSFPVPKSVTFAVSGHVAGDYYTAVQTGPGGPSPEPAVRACVLGPAADLSLYVRPEL